MTKFRSLDLGAVPSEKLRSISQCLHVVALACFSLWIGTDITPRVFASTLPSAAAFVPSWWWSAATITVIASLLFVRRQIERHIDRREERRP